MKYFQSKRIEAGGEIYGFKLPEVMVTANVKHYLYDRTGNLELHGVDCATGEVAALIAGHDPRCEVTEKSYADASPKLLACRFMQEINARTVARIQAVYDPNREASIVKLGTASVEFLKMQTFIGAQREIGRADKIALGIYRTDDGLLNWVAGERVLVNAVRTYLTVKYKCIQAHTTQSDWTPNITPALWDVVATSSNWTAGVAYKVNDIVKYVPNTFNYKCLQAHTAQVGWEPPSVPALWQKQN